MPDKLHTDDLIIYALKEDMPFGDITTDNTVKPGTRTKAVLIAKEELGVAGTEIFERVFMLMDEVTVFKRHAQYGDRVTKGFIFLEFEGDASVLLKGERTSLNIQQHMS